MNKKKNKHMKIWLGTGLFVIVGLVCFMLGAYLLHWDVLGWFVSQQAFLIYGCIILGIIGLISIIWMKKVKDDE